MCFFSGWNVKYGHFKNVLVIKRIRGFYVRRIPTSISADKDWPY